MSLAQVPWSGRLCTYQPKGGGVQSEATGMAPVARCGQLLQDLRLDVTGTLNSRFPEV